MEPAAFTLVKKELTVDRLVLILDLVGTFIFALSGAIAAVWHRLDLFGVLVLSFAAATFGGIIRDLLIGAVPPAAISNWRYLAVSLFAGIITFYWHPAVNRLKSPVLIFDAAGLGLFAVAGTHKALSYGLDPLMAALLGMLTGIGGGIARDLLLNEIPVVLKAELYAVAALAGATVVSCGELLRLPSALTSVVGAALCFCLRFMAIRHGWQLPVPRGVKGPTQGANGSREKKDDGEDQQ